VKRRAASDVTWFRYLDMRMTPVSRSGLIFASVLVTLFAGVATLIARGERDHNVPGATITSGRNSIVSPEK